MLIKPRTLETEVQNFLDPKKNFIGPQRFWTQKIFLGPKSLGSKLTLSLAQLSPSLFGPLELVLENGPEN